MKCTFSTEREEIMTRIEAERIAKEFLNETNPDMWNGTDGMPDNFDTI